MFDFVQKHKKFIQIFLFLIALTFMTWGIESYTRFRGDADTIASVNGIDISQREFAEQLRRQQEQMRQLLGGGFDPAALDTPEARRAVLDQMIAQRLLASAVVGAGLTVPDDTLYDSIATIPAFQKDGRYDPETAKQILRAQNPPLSPAQFEASMRHDLALAQLTRAVGDSAILPRAVSERIVALQAQKREVSDARIPAQQFLAQVKIDEAAVKSHYDANQADYRTPERVKAEYVVLSAEMLGRREGVTDAEIKAAYEARAQQYKVEEQRRASHILVASREEADKLLQEVKKAPARFAELAKKHSQDSGSAEKGGDLGWFGRGMMVKPFEDLVFRLAQHDTQVVQSEFGFHVVRLTGIQAGAARPLDEVKKELADELLRQKGARKFAEAAEGFSNMVYEQPDSLNPVAERFKLQVQTTGWVAKSASQELGALDHPKMLAALFSADALKNKRNTDAIEVAPSTLVAARVVEHQPATQRKFEEVKDEIADLLKRREAAQLARKEGAAKLAELRKGGDAGVKWSAPRTVSRRDAQGLPVEVLREVVSADVSKLPAYVGMPVEDAGYLLLRISKVIEADLKAEAPDAVARVAGLIGSAQYEAYVASLRSRAKVEINQTNLEKK